MRIVRFAGLLALLLVAVGAAFAYRTRKWQQYEREMQNPAEDPPDADVPGEYAFARLRYRSAGRGRRGSSWGTDSNKAERVFSQGLRRLTRVHTRSVEEIIDVDSDEIYNWPWLYAVEVGHWQLSDEQAKRIRTYLDRGGFLMVDDFHGGYEWEVFNAGLTKIFPDRAVIEIPDEDQIFHVVFDLEKRFQIPGYQYVRSGRTYERQDGQQAHWRGVLDEKGRIQLAICFNSDLGDAWEWADDPEYPEAFASLAYRIGVNYVVYSMTH